MPLLLGTALALGACSDDDDDSDGTDPDTGGDVPVLTGEPDFTLQLLHFADVDGTGGALDNVDAFSALVAGYRAALPERTVLLSSGDNFIPGPRFVASGDDALADLLGIPGEGRGDIALLNALGVQASAVGNHDLDRGPDGLAALIAPSSETDEDSGEASEYVGASFPYLSANLDFSSDENLAPLTAEGGQSASSVAGQVAPSATLDVDGETIGIVGATTPALASITSSGGIGVRPTDADDIDALAAEIQPAVDALREAGTDKIVLLAHMQQIAVERALATRLTDVDIIVAGGSNTILADANDTLLAGDSAADDYPLAFASASGEPVLLVNTDGDYRYLGRLVVGFDAEGRVLNGELDDTVNGAYAATDENVAALGAEAVPIAGVVALSDALGGVLAARDGNILGTTDVYLDGRRSEVRTEETNLGNLTADANLWIARQADPSTTLSIKNGGGIRAPIGVEVQPPGTTDPAETEFLPPQANEMIGRATGDISQLDVETALRFDNGLTLLTVTAAELRDILEHALAASEPGATPGQFPQVAGLALSFDPAEPARVGGDTNGAATVAGSRVRTLSIVDADGNTTDTVVDDGALVGDPARAFRLVILDFIAKCVGVDGEDCGDGYPLKGLAAPDRVDIADAGTDPGLADFARAGGEQDALAEYLAVFHPADGSMPFDAAETPPGEDTRIRDLSAPDEVAD